MTINFDENVLVYSVLVVFLRPKSLFHDRDFGLLVLMFMGKSEDCCVGRKCKMENRG